jgi:hypothetical protein
LFDKFASSKRGCFFSNYGVNFTSRCCLNVDLASWHSLLFITRLWGGVKRVVTLLKPNPNGLLFVICTLSLLIKGFVEHVEPKLACCNGEMVSASKKVHVIIKQI